MSTTRHFLPDGGVFFDGRIVRDCVLRVSDDKVSVLQFHDEVQTDTILLLKGVVSPGLVDLQVNGGGGYLFNADPSLETIGSIIKTHHGFGTAALLPTVITDRPQITEAAANAVVETWGMRGLAGIHIEGPHISLAKRGTHNPDLIRALDDHTIGLAARLRKRNIPVLLTLAPEAASIEGIKRLVDLGVVISIGHSNATARQVEAALDAGAKNFTHLYNAMSQMQGREPGVAGAALLSSADIGIICDGEHVDDRMIQLAIRAHGLQRMHIVSDAMPTVGGPAEFELYGNLVRLVGGRLVNGEGNLAGAHTTMAEGVNRLVTRIGLSLEDALQMAITNPARVMGLEYSCSSVDDYLVWDGEMNPTHLSKCIDNISRKIT